MRQVPLYVATLRPGHTALGNRECGNSKRRLRLILVGVQGCLAHKKNPTRLGPP